ncbi:hypothetical protein [Ruegeria arenilitoris]|uniref:hypothetical protein n=1 Tax=Ruegeria arenilitoris TaxID=1173585 RepID=UPI0014807892|nr:hypothetical protein [Ruegeria arenilitoris]
MLSWQIFKHALGMIFNDLGTALRVSSPVIAVSLLGVLLFIVKGPAFVTGEQGVAGGVFLLAILNYIAALWVAVGWHRYCLLSEYPSKVFPEFNGSRILAYFGWALLLGLIFAGMALVLVGVVYVVGGIGTGSFSLLGGAVLTVGFIFIFWVAQRLSLILPASAVGNTISISESWRATQTVATAIIMVFLFFFAFSFVLGLLAGFVGAFSGFLGFVLQAVVNWMIAMVGLSILTTFYGICVEKRELA